MGTEPRRRAPGVAGSAPRARPSARRKPPDTSALLEGGHRDPSQQNAVEHMQRTVGNRATTALLGTVQRDAPTAVDAGPRQRLDDALANPANRDLIALVPDFIRATADERLTLLDAMAVAPLRDEHDRAAVWNLWRSFGTSRLPVVASEHYELWTRCNRMGAFLPPEWLGNATGEAHTSVTEMVGADHYVAEGFYSFVITNDAVVISVPMSFHADAGVTPPIDTWFQYIRDTWNRFTAVNTEDVSKRRRIVFQPITGDGAQIQVSRGNGRANAAHYYAGDTRADVTIPHEFGHLIGLEDEYEREAADYERVTGEAAPAGDSTRAVPALQVAVQLYGALHDEEHLLEWHSTAVNRRQRLTDQVLTTAGITADYQRGENSYTHEIAQMYRAVYGRDIADDVEDQVDGESRRGWRERVAGTFEYTSTSIMGDMTDHTHPVEPRHVRRFVAHVAALYGGQWSAQPNP